MKKKPGAAGSQSAAEPVAIVGMGCRFPGAPDLDQYWCLLVEGRDAITEVPPERWDIGAVYNPAPGTPGKLNTRWGAFLEHLDLFDASFFGISHREANDMDPQQRLVMEVAWEALENGGLAPDKLAGSKTGVFLGIGGVDYTHLSLRAENHLQRISAYMGTGNSHSIAANRLSYFLDLRGPSLALDTACSSSLVAVHLACQSLGTGECDLALAGGVNVILTPEVSIAFSQAHMLASSGRCRTFDAEADGYVRGEGCGIVVLKRLSDAVASRDCVLALVRGTAVNQDGRSNGLTAPNPFSQRAAVIAALQKSGVAPSEIDYVEAHGTGTPLGDPIEMRALAEALAPGRAPEQPCFVGSVKTNIGHLETASGIAGLIKVVLALRHQQIPAHLNFRRLNPNIQLQSSPLQVVTERRPWPAGGKRRFGGVCSYGFGGTNAHILIEEGRQPALHGSPERSAHLLVLSARSADALKQAARRMADRSESLSPDDLPHLCFTANAGRAHFSDRVAVPASSTAELVRKLRAFADGAVSPSVHYGHVQGCRRRKVAFLFTGQGSQYSRMGKQLFDEQPTFRRTLETCAAVLAPHLDQPLLEVLFPSAGEDSPLDSTAYAQPALFALEYALAQMWLSWGIRPDVILGHSLGEYVAACVAGVFSLEDGLRLVAARARLMQALPRNGAMCALFCSEEQAAAETASYPDRVSIAAVNGPEHTVISGERDAVERITAKLLSGGVASRPLAVSHAFHSPLVEPVLQAFRQAAGRIRFAAPRLPLVSNLTGALLENGYVPGPDYWQRHMRATVNFARGMAQLDEIGCNLFVEVGPSPVLLGMGKSCFPKKDALWIPSLRQGEDAWRTLLDSLGTMFVSGFPVDWEGFDRDHDRRKISLPTYPFERQSCWLESYKNRHYEVVDQPRAANARPIGHPLLGNRLTTAHAAFQVKLDSASPAFLTDHVIDGMTLLPGSAYLEMGLAAGVAASNGATCRVSDIELRRAMLVPDGKTKTIEISVLPDTFGDLSFQVCGREDGPEENTWTLHAEGKIQRLPTSAPPAEIEPSLNLIRARCSAEIRGADLYSQLREAGFGYGPQFQGVDRVWLGAREALAELRVPGSLESTLGAYHIHPAVLDACFHVLAAAVSAEIRSGKAGGRYLPVSIKRFELRERPPREFLVYARLADDGDIPPNLLEGDVHLMDSSGRVIGSVLGLRSQRTDRAPIPELEAVDDYLSEFHWDRVELKKGSQKSPATWLIFADQAGRAEAVAERLQAVGGTCTLVFAGSQSSNGHATRHYVEADLPGLIEQLRPEGSRQQFGIIHCWSLDCAKRVTTESLQDAQKLGCLSVLRLLHALSGLPWTQAPRLWLVTAGAQDVNQAEPVAVAQSPLWGLGRTIAHELPDFRCTCVDLSTAAIADEDALLCDEVRSGDSENQIAFRDRHRYVARIRRRQRTSAGSAGRRYLGLSPESAFRVENAAPGSLDGLMIRPSRRRELAPSEVEIEVKAAGLNFRDVMKAMGIYPTGDGQAAWLGDECAGTIVAVGNCVRQLQPGDEVIALGPACFSSHTNIFTPFVVPKPAELTFEQAATIPVAFTTAYYGVHHLARLAPGERVLIHAATGGVGMAAIQVAQRCQAEIFATAGSVKKREFLRSLGVKHVFDSRTLTFAAEIMDVTGGGGVDVALNSLSGEAIPRTLSILASGGRFVEIGKRDIYQDSKLGLWPFRKNLSFFAVDMEALFHQRPDLATSLLSEVMQHVKRGNYRPLPSKVFSATDAASAFRHMAQAKQIGKVVLSFSPLPKPAAPIHTLPVDATYLVTGGLGTLGLASAAWLVKKGARNLVLAGRSQPSATAEQAIAAMRSVGADVRVVAADVAEEEQVIKLLKEISEGMPPLKGVVHAAGILDDGFLLQLTADRFDNVWRPKVMGAWNLHVHTLGAPLDFFVLFSSAASILGSPGQANYASANAFLDCLAHYRRSMGQTALSINWGPWSGGGMAARSAGRGAALRVMAGIDADRAFAILEDLLQENLVQAGVMRFHWDSLQRVYPAMADSPLLAGLAPHRPQSSEFKNPPAFVEKILAAPAHARGGILGAFLQAEVARILQVEISRVSLQEPLLNLGLDSLMGIELFTSIESELNITLPRVGFLQAPSISQLALRILELLVTAGSTHHPGAANQTRAAHAAVQQDAQTGLQQQAS